MSANHLLSIQIENLRGAVTPFKLPFEKGKKLTIVYGENGTGKSTLSDAFDFLGNGKVGSLERRGLGITQKYWPSIGKAAGDVKVTLEMVGGSCSASLGKNDISVANEPLRPKVAVLRRSEIRTLIEAQPADRYKAISRFVDVSAIEASEAAIGELIRNKTAEFNSATTRVTENLGEIERFWNQADSPLPDAVTWAQLEVQKDQSDLDNRKIVLDRLIAVWDALAAHSQKVAAFAVQCKSAESARKRAEEGLGEAKDAVESDYLAVLDLLKAAQFHLLSHPNPRVCPVCESSEKVAGLAESVNRRIQSQRDAGKLEAAKQAVASTARAAGIAQQRLHDALGDALADTATFKALCSGGELPPDLQYPNLAPADDITTWPAWIAENQPHRTTWGVAAMACVEDKKFINTLRTSLVILDENKRRAEELETLLPHIKAAAELAAGERKKFTDTILSLISARVGELYEAIHPGEGLNKITLALAAGRRASLDIATQFADTQAAPPGAYFSDSHLDTLGLCVFLALAERDAPGDTLLVLDDVLGSVDEPHVERIIGVLYDVLQRFRHAVITTHYRPWREKFRWGVLKPDQTCHFVELGMWGIDKGISVSGAMIPEIVRLKTLLSDPNPDVQAITSKAGVILEALLDFLTLQYGCAVPRRQGNTYVLSDLLGAVNGKLLAALKIESVDPVVSDKIVATVELKPVLDELAGIAQTRNVLGAHFNSLAFDLYPADALRFATLVEQLSDALVCPNHGRPIKDTGSYWRNSGNTRRLYPLKKPT